MTEYEIQFRPEDITKKFEHVYKLKKKGKTDHRPFYQHEMQSPLIQLKRKIKIQYKSCDDLENISVLLSVLFECSDILTKNYKIHGIDKLNTDVKILIYMANMLFSQTFDKQIFYFDQDMKFFFRDVGDIIDKDNIRLESDGIWPIKTNENYIPYAVSPLVWNAREHALE